jgi:hypothetical protein
MEGKKTWSVVKLSTITSGVGESFLQGRILGRLWRSNMHDWLCIVLSYPESVIVIYVVTLFGTFANKIG